MREGVVNCMTKLTKKQMKALYLLDQVLTQEEKLTAEEAAIVGEFISACINNQSLNKAAFHLIKQDNHIPLTAVFMVIDISFRTRRLANVIELLQNKQNHRDIESFYEFALLRDFFLLQKTLNQLDRYPFLKEQHGLHELKITARKSHDMISALEEMISADPVGMKVEEEIELFKELSHHRRSLLQYFHTLTKLFKFNKISPVNKS